ncbi:hypothetical protein [Janthinobacterium sp. B9-8]|uniref:hypothetical protein n=1 Tax=Janthinobacterium sp. B9-8 TaxID=1236179 RepID=UPI00061CEDA3|nr:hypothetical protein [Janthinobacterium sp. B9-8]AMC34718.1 hypothetical protein VN23_08910 [Janthinobacterium sp. B9-8]
MNLLTQLPDLLQAASSVVGVASVIAALVPSPKVRGALSKARAVLDFLAFNFGNAKNAKTIN